MCRILRISHVYVQQSLKIKRKGLDQKWHYNLKNEDLSQRNETGIIIVFILSDPKGFCLYSYKVDGNYSARQQKSTSPVTKSWAFRHVMPSQLVTKLIQNSPSLNNVQAPNSLDLSSLTNLSWLELNPEKSGTTTNDIINMATSCQDLAHHY